MIVNTNCCDLKHPLKRHPWILGLYLDINVKCQGVGSACVVTPPPPSTTARSSAY